jgi:hypothetical protein
MELLAVIGAGVATAFATGAGAVPVFVLGDRAERVRPLLAGVAVGSRRSPRSRAFSRPHSTTATRPPCSQPWLWGWRSSSWRAGG